MPRGNQSAVAWDFVEDGIPVTKGIGWIDRNTAEQFAAALRETSCLKAVRVHHDVAWPQPKL